MTRIAVLLLVFFLGACAKQGPIPDQTSTSRIWSALHPEAIQTGVNAQFSAHVSSSKRSGRLLAQVWGYPDRALRMDLTSGLGTAVAMTQETPTQWLVYLPEENKAYRQNFGQDGLTFFQIPIPLNIRQLCALFSGDLGPILGGPYTSAKITTDHVRFVFAHGAVATLMVPTDLSSLTLQGRNGWILKCEQPHADPVFPGRQLFEKFTFLSPRDGKAVLRVKTLEHGRNWPEAALDLALPATVHWMRGAAASPQD